MAIDWASLIVDDIDGNTLLDALKLYLGIDIADPTDDEALSRALALAGDICENYIDRVIAKRPVDEYFQSHFGRVTLHNMPVDTAEPVNVFVDGVEQTGYSIFQQQWRLAHLTRQNYQHDMPLDWRGYEQVTVTYTAGFDPLPTDIAQAIVYVSSDLYKSEGTGNLPGGGSSSGEVKSMAIYDVGSMSFDVGSTSSDSGGSISAFGLINETATHLLSRYKRYAA